MLREYTNLITKFFISSVRTFSFFAEAYVQVKESKDIRMHNFAFGFRNIFASRLMLSIYLLFERGAVWVKTIADRSNVVMSERLRVTQVIRSHKVYHAPVLFKSVLERIAGQNNSRCALNTLTGCCQFGLSRNKSNRSSE